MARILLKSCVVVTLCVAYVSATETSLGEEQPIAAPSHCICPEALLHGCCDDYCRKPCPIVPCLNACCQPDNYCGKPCPPIWCFNRCGGVDDYCRKTCPNLCRPLFSNYFICVPLNRVGCCEDFYDVVGVPSGIGHPTDMRKLDRDDAAMAPRN